MAAAGEYLEVSLANRQELAGDETSKSSRHFRHHAQIAMSVGQQLLCRLGIQAMGAVEAAIWLGVECAGVEVDGQADEVLGLAHPEAQPESLAQPAGESHVIGVIVRDQDPRQLSPAQGPR